MDFFNSVRRDGKPGEIDVYPDFQVMRMKDLMIRGQAFHAVWVEEDGMWSTDEFEVRRLVDRDITIFAQKVQDDTGVIPRIKYMSNFNSGAWKEFQSYLRNLPDTSRELDENLTFANTEVTKDDHVSRRLPYPLEQGNFDAYDELIGTLYDPEERKKLEWAVGAIIAGDAKYIQKFVVLYGAGGTGKSTFLNILMKLTEGYYTTFEAKALTSNNNNFATEVFRKNPLVAIQHDGDLSKIEDNSKFNSIISHEEMTMNEKYKSPYDARINAFLFMGTNKPVRITDAKSGIIRRLLDVRPSGQKVSPRTYQTLVSQIDFELGAIAYHCLEVYRAMGPDYYSTYRPVEMMLQTDVFYNFIEDYYDIFAADDGTTLNQAYEMFKEYSKNSSLDYVTPKFRFREELKNYFNKFEEKAVVDGVRVHSYYSEFQSRLFRTEEEVIEEVLPLTLEYTESIFDTVAAGEPAQYAKDDGYPLKFWDNSERTSSKGKKFIPRPDQIVDTTLYDLDTTQLHYVKLPENHIVIDFDLTDDDGNKSAERNLEEASKWPATYAEYSKSGAGIHLHYFYTGDVSELSRVYSDGIEIKVFIGNSSLRRRLSKCNNVPISSISYGLPLKEKKKMLNVEQFQSEKGLRDFVERNMRKEIHSSTKPSMDFINKGLNDAYNSGLQYDLTDMRNSLLVFANNSTNQAMQSIKILQGLKLKSEDVVVEEPSNAVEKAKDDRIVFFDVEVFPNLFVIVWKFQGSKQAVRMINPSKYQVEELLSFKLVGFNNRRYDNHIIYAAAMGYTIEQLYKLSQKMINGAPNALFGEAYELSYADIYDFSSKKQSLKKFEIELGVPHLELGLDWDQPVPEELWNKVAEYCENDVNATEATFEDREQDFVARQILADISKLSINQSTLQHTARIIFGTDRAPQTQFKYTDLSEEFPGYTFDLGKSWYRDELVGEGGYVYAEPGMYTNVALLDVASMHPTSIEILDLFGPYTKNFSALKEARLAIKRRDYDTARQMLNGVLAPYLTNVEDAEKLSYALKIVINIVYGVTSARFPNAFKDPRNKDNIVAKRGALFMIDLKHAVQEQGFTVAHIKTDSIKIPNATNEIIQFVMEFGQRYGYTFEHEATYEKLALVNDAVYVAKTEIDGHAKWTAVGAQFQHPYVYKTLFSEEPITFRDFCEAKFVQTGKGLYLDFAEGGDKAMVLDRDDLHFVGKAGLFTPVAKGGALLLREKDGKLNSAPNAKGYRWLESHMVQTNNLEDDVDMSYYQKLVDDALENLGKHGDTEWFLS